MNSTMTTTTFESFKENFETHKHNHLEGGVHPEFFYVNFFLDVILPQVDSLLTDDDKESFVQEWIESLGDDELEGKTFEEILEDNDYLGEDITDWVINSDSPSHSDVKEQFIQQLFVEMFQ